MRFEPSTTARCSAAWATYEPTAVDALTRAERRECAALSTEPRRRDWLSGRVAAKRAIGRYFGIVDPLRITLLPRDLGAPQCSDRVFGLLPVSISIAHAAGHAVAVATGAGARVGVDLEREGSIREAFVRLFAGRDERSRSPFVDPTVRWVLKEAAWKAFGCAPDLPLSALALEFDARRALCAVAIAGTRHTAVARTSHPWPGFVAAVVHAPAEVM